MVKKIIEGKSVEEWIEDYPLLKQIMDTEETLWINQKITTKSEYVSLTGQDISDTSERLQRFAPYFEVAFTETVKTNGIIESPLIEIQNMKTCMEKDYGIDLKSRLLLKCDSHLPISGSIKARGGIYAVIKYAEELAVKHNLLSYSDSYTVLDDPAFKQFFSQFSIAVGSTGNLGLSIGIISARLGFNMVPEEVREEYYQKGKKSIR